MFVRHAVQWSLSGFGVFNIYHAPVICAVENIFIFFGWDGAYDVCYAVCQCTMCLSDTLTTCRLQSRFQHTKKVFDGIGVLFSRFFYVNYVKVMQPKKHGGD